MKLYIDASRANKPERTGVEWYAFKMIQALKKVIPQETGVLLLTKENLMDDFGEFPKNWKHKKLHWPFPRFWTQLRLSWEMRKHKDAILFIPASAPPLIHPKLVVTIHDVGFAAMPKVYSWFDRKFQDWTTRRAVNHADLICTPSQFSKNEIKKYYDAKDAHIAIVPNALVVDEMSTPRKPSQALLYIGRIEHKKNITTLIEAFEILKRSGNNVELQLVGKPGFGYEEIAQRIEQSIYKKDIHLLGYISQQKKSELLSQAGILLFPSWYEGFGIPILEAAAYGVPVIASNIPVHKEIAADTITYAQVDNPRDWVKKVEEMFESYPPSQDMIDEKKQILNQYSWGKSAQIFWENVQKLQTVD
ncbi:MAG: hypothetical protein CMI52_00405 [Parcubacteria group bacterium]|nr:hypothetical protein [Parcubacteria group bacterium]|tara:strand:+ start:965 stop:2047 length:1083 start_codon:yes stop_codon:yes gene_type:complete